MTSILKNQIIKHLSAFARNLKPDQITMEVLRGKGQLRNLELNEEVLAEKLELPPWMKIVSATCDRVSINIPWRRLKSAPVKLFVDEIRVSVRLVASAVTTSHQKMNQPPPPSQPKSYDLAERVIETLSLYVQSVEVFFESDSGAEIGFGGSITLYNLVLKSMRPNWVEEEEVNINLTRIHDKTIRQLLFFKQLSWRLLKIEASANPKGADEHREPLKSKTNSPLRLLTVDGKCRISIKKNSQDCSLLAGKIELILEEIHWLATIFHLKMAIDFYEHLLDLANCQRKGDPTQLLAPQQNPFMDHRHPTSKVKPPSLGVPASSSAAPAVPPASCSAFRQLDLLQSSHHLHIAKLDLLLLDDSESNLLPSDWHLEKGAMQAFLHRLRVDFYPQHRVFDDNGEMATRHHWIRYQSPNSFTDLATQQLLQHFRLLSTKMDANKRERFVRIWPQLASQNVVIRVDNIVLQQVTEQSTKKEALREMFSMDKRAKDRMPHSMSFFHLEISNYFFPATNAFPVPPDSCHLVMAPLELTPDVKSIRWLVYALECIANAIDAPQISAPNSADQHQKLQIRIELFMPKVVLIPASQQNDNRLPKRFILRTSTVLLSNFVLLNDPLVPLPILFKNKMDAKHFQFVEWAEGHSVEAKLAKELRRKSHFDGIDNADFLLEHSQRDEWLLSIPSLWLNCDFGPNTWELPLLTDLSIFGFILLDKTDPSQPGNCILVEPKTDMGLIVDHFQFLQLTQLLNDVTTLLDQISTDREFFRKNMQNLPDELPLAVYCKFEKIHLRLILPVGPAPSPYDPKWTGANVSPSCTSMSCSDLPADETASNSAQQLPLSRREVLTPTIGSESNRRTVTQSVVAAETVEDVRCQQQMDGLRTVRSLCNVSAAEKTLTPRKAPQADDFVDILKRTVAISSDLESNLDETLSIGTSNSAEQIIIDGTTTTEDELFGVLDDDVVEAEEAIENVPDIATLRRKEKTLGRQVNVFDVLLEDLNIYVGTIGGRTTALGFASKVHCGERLRKNCGEVYEERGATFEMETQVPELGEATEKEAQSEEGTTMLGSKLKLEVRTAPKQSAIRVDVSGVDICVSDEVISQLAPFIANPIEDEHPPALELSLQKCRIEIKDPKKKFPLRIQLGELNIEDGPNKHK